MPTSPPDNAHRLDSDEPAWQRGHMAARLAIADCPTPSALGHLRRHAEQSLAKNEQEAADAWARLLYARGFSARMTALDLVEAIPEQETPHEH